VVQRGEKSEGGVVFIGEEVFFDRLNDLAGRCGVEVCDSRQFFGGHFEVTVFEPGEVLLVPPRESEGDMFGEGLFIVDEEAPLRGPDDLCEVSVGDGVPVEVIVREFARTGKGGKKRHVDDADIENSREGVDDLFEVVLGHLRFIASVPEALCEIASEVEAEGVEAEPSGLLTDSSGTVGEIVVETFDDKVGSVKEPVSFAMDIMDIEGPYAREFSHSRQFAVRLMVLMSLILWRQVIDVHGVEGKADERRTAHLGEPSPFEFADKVIHPFNIVKVERDADGLIVGGF